ncbi:unnamed protein product [Closterium sp. NIES-53]
MPGMHERGPSPPRPWNREGKEECFSPRGNRELVASRTAVGVREEEQGPPPTCRWNSASLPKVEVADRYTGIPGVGPTLKNYVMQLETAQYCWERGGFDPQEFFRKMVVTLAGEAETFYQMVRGEVLDELEQGLIENPTKRFIQLLKREFIEQPKARLEEFREFRRRKEESLLAYYNRLQELAEDLEKRDEWLLVQNFVRGLDDDLRPVVRTAVYGIGADVTLKEVYGVAKRTEHAQLLLELDDGELRARTKPS